MIVAVVALCTVIAGSVGLVAYLVHAALGDRARTADTLFDLATANAEIERASFELEATKQALAAATNRAAALERSLIDAIETADSDLAPGDVRGRVLRIVEAWRTDRPDGEVPAGRTGPVLDPSATE